ncbi:MAG: 4'-phosphopantetheinyl transferase superfamily protein [Vicinamibacteria bacterium]
MALVGIGIDLIETERVLRSLGRFGERLVRRLMDPPEAGRLPREPAARARALALAIAAKEAASKAIGTGWSRGVRWRDVDVRLGEPPTLALRAQALAEARRLGSDGRCLLRLELRDGVAIGEAWLLAGERS